MSQDWTTNNIPDLTGKVILVTGANSGIGFEATKEFGRKGAHVVMGCRNMSKAEAAMTELQQELPQGKFEIMQLDLASQKSVHAFAAAFNAKFDRLDVLVNNAGIMMVPYGKTEDGLERQMGTNHFGHFALTGLLIDLLKATPNARVVSISSSGHRFGSMDFDNLLFEDGKDYTPMRSYGRSKLANLLFTYELQRRFEANNVDAIAVAAHPGGSDTNLGNHLEGSLLWKIMMPLMGRMMQSAAGGALPTLRAGADPAVQGSDYFGPKGMMEMAGPPVKVKSNKASHNVADQRRLWEMSEELTGVRYL
ncbi:MAG: oxidoreductase [Chloroflexota bacterium]